MVNRPKDIGTRFETSVVRYLRESGFPGAERRALAGAADLGDITGCPGIVWECKAGQAAYKASDAQVNAWLIETETERRAAHADAGVLVLDRSGYGPARVGSAWAVFRLGAFEPDGADGAAVRAALASTGALNSPVRMHLATAVLALRANGYGTPLPGMVVGAGG